MGNKGNPSELICETRDVGQKSRIRETLNLSTDANSSTDTFFFSIPKKSIFWRGSKSFFEGVNIFFVSRIFFGGGPAFLLVELVQSKFEHFPRKLGGLIQIQTL